MGKVVEGKDVGAQNHSEVPFKSHIDEVLDYKCIHTWPVKRTWQRIPRSKRAE